jgi:uncharacterized protein YegP (UPF0339 family)
VKKTSNGQSRFNLVASNGQVIATSESYTRKTSALEHHRLDPEERRIRNHRR